MVIGRIHFVMVVDWFGSTFGGKKFKSIKSSGLLWVCTNCDWIRTGLTRWNAGWFKWPVLFKI